MRRLLSYADGKQSWVPERALTSEEATQCRLLHASLIHLGDDCFAPILDRVTAREMETFTAHDRHHAMKVAEIMWQIISPERRDLLTPPEIGLLVLAAFLHDMGMGLSPEDRETRLAPDSDLWMKSDLLGRYRAGLVRLSEAAADPQASALAARVLHQAEEAILCSDSRERHATVQRYREMLDQIRSISSSSRGRIGELGSLLRFGGDSFEADLVQVCASHNEDASVLSGGSVEDAVRFPTDAPFGCATADLSFVGAALRMADILDFDRERTPEVLFHYMLPSVDPSENISVREWSKHLAISNWKIEADGSLVYRCNCEDPVVHHAITLFVDQIRQEISNTRAVLGSAWPFVLNGQVDAKIREVGYKYYPYRFRLDETKVYHLLMGARIYKEKIAAIRELVQNAVDACKLKDAISRMNDASFLPSRSNRICVSYIESGETFSVKVSDTGIGMDSKDIESYFLCVGKSYYKSTEFVRLKSKLMRAGVSSSPISEFGIGFLSTFLLGDKVNVTTSKWPSPDKVRNLKLDGVSKLIHVDESEPDYFNCGTSVEVKLRENSNEFLSWKQLISYLRHVCQGLPYNINAQRFVGGELVENEVIEPSDDNFVVPEGARDYAYIVDLEEGTLSGRVVLFQEQASAAAASVAAEHAPVAKVDSEDRDGFNVLVRDGFRIGSVPGLPRAFLYGRKAMAKISVGHEAPWESDLARTGLVNNYEASKIIRRLILTKILTDPALPALGRHELDSLHGDVWLQDFSALHLYETAKTFWSISTERKEAIERWEKGEGTLKFGWPHGLVDRRLFDLVLPAICSRTLLSEGSFRVGPPIADWMEMLRGCHDFIDKFSGWPDFEAYDEEL